jgi:hypothetical protein
MSLFLRSVLLTMQPAVPGFYVSAPVTESRSNTATAFDTPVATWTFIPSGLAASL